MATFGGKCSRCGREYYSSHADVVVCDCWEHCPECGADMEPYVPDLAPSTYGVNGKRGLLILRVCYNTAEHADSLPFFSTQKPVQVELERLT